MATITGTIGKDKLKGTTLADTINGLAGADQLWGGLGNDVINGGDGNDKIYGETGNDTLNGGNHNDLAYGGAGDDTVNGDAGADKLYGDAGDDTVSGGTGNDVVWGGAGVDTLTGGDGYDTIYGGFGIDDLDGGALNDILVGGHGADDIDGGTGTDTVSYAISDVKFGVIISLAAGAGFEGDAQGDVYTSIENATGSVYDDEIYGDGAANVLNGYSGNDYIEDGLGNDTVYGGDGTDWIVATEGGTDVYDGGVGTGDLFDVTGWAAGVTLNMTTGVMGADKVRGFEWVKATDLADTITGSAGNDRIEGGDGADVIRSMAGSDKLYGGFSGTADTAADTFVFVSTDVVDATLGWLGADKIYDFDGGNDIIDISAMLDGIDVVADIDLDAAVTLTEVGGNTIIESRYTTANTDQYAVAIIIGVTGLGDASDMRTAGQMDTVI